MKFAGETEIHTDPAAVWQALGDTEVLAAAIPGCESVEGNVQDGFSAVVVQKIGPIKARFRGKVMIEEVEPLARYRLTGQGDGGIAGFAKGAADVTLTATEGGTLLSYDVDAQIGGKMAQLGNRLMAGLVTKLVGEFFAAFRARITPEAPEITDPEVTVA